MLLYVLCKSHCYSNKMDYKGHKALHCCLEKLNLALVQPLVTCLSEG